MIETKVTIKTLIQPTMPQGVRLTEPKQVVITRCDIEYSMKYDWLPKDLF